LLSWTVTFLSGRRGQLTITEQQAFARTRLEQLAVMAAEARQGEAAKAAS
jgi:NADH:ubiquinone reductase (H+-translocating)